MENQLVFVFIVLLRDNVDRVSCHRVNVEIVEFFTRCLQLPQLLHN